MQLKLVSFKICPFVQRSVITLLYKHVPFDIEYVDLASPPQWFTELSPFGTVPLLIVDDKRVIFESAVINEFLDEITPGTLLPHDPLMRALDRSWIDFGGACLLTLSGLMHARDQESFDDKLAELKGKLGWLESILEKGPYFNGENLSLVDFAYAPLFMRIEMLGLYDELCENNRCQRLAQWGELLLTLPEVRNSVLPEFPELLGAHVQAKAPYAFERLGLKLQG